MLADPALWHLDPEIDFLNHGSFGACPRSVLAEQQRLQVELERQPLDFQMGAWRGGFRQAIRAPARLLGCSPDDLVFVENASTGVNAVLRSFDWRAGDAVLTTTHAYGAVRQALRYLEHRYEVQVIEVPVPFPLSGPDEVIDAVRGGLDHPRIRLAVLDHITSMTALILPITELSALCHERGVPVLVDGAHGPGHFPIDVPAIGADWYTGNLHKWAFAPKGCAVLWVEPDRQATTHPLTISHDYEGGLAAEFDWTGTRDPSGWLAAPAAIAFLEDLGIEPLAEHNHALVTQAAAMLSEAWGTELPAPGSMNGAMCTVRLPMDLPATESAASALHDRLRAERIEVPCFPFGDRVWLRISAQAYNRIEDYLRLAEVIRAG